jgi:hypothetical protein
MQGGQWQRSLQARPHGPAVQTAAIKVEHSGQVQPAFPGFHISHVGNPYFVRLGRSGGFGQQVWRDRIVARAVGRAHPIPTGLPALQSGFSHQSGHAAAANLLALLVEGHGHPRAPIRATGGSVHFGNLHLDRLGLKHPRRILCASPLVVSAARDRQRLSHRHDRMFVAHRFNPGLPRCDGSEGMSSAFFRMSLCSVILAGSCRSRSFSACNGSLHRPIPVAELEHADPKLPGRQLR